jgi:hypothetical protein
MTRAQAAEMLRLQRRTDRRVGCLWGLVMTVLFGVWYWCWLAVKWTAIGSVKLARIGWTWTLIACRWAWLGTVALTRLTIKGAQAAAPLALAAVASVTAAIQRRGAQAQLPPAPQVTPDAPTLPTTHY